MVPRILDLLTDTLAVGMADSSPLATEGTNLADTTGNSRLVDMASNPADTEVNRVAMVRAMRLKGMEALIRREAMVANPAGMVVSPAGMVASPAGTAEESLADMVESQEAMTVVRVVTATPMTTLSRRTAAAPTRTRMVVTKNRATAAVEDTYNPMTTSMGLATKSATVGTILLMNPTREGTGRVVTTMKAGTARAATTTMRAGIVRVVNQMRAVDTSHRTARAATRTRMASVRSTEEGEEVMVKVRVRVVMVEVMDVATMTRGVLIMAATTETTTRHSVLSA